MGKTSMLIIVAALAMAAASCGTARHSSSTHTDYMSAERTDSTRHAETRHDSIYIRDSIFIRERGDTVLKYVERTAYVMSAVHDTIHHDRTLTDTIFAIRTDTIVQTEYRAKAVPWYDTGCMWIGRACIVCMSVVCLLMWRKGKASS